MRKRFFGGSRVFASILLLAGSTATSNSYALYNSSSPLGTNTNEVLEYDSSVPYLDLFKASLPFREGAPHLTKGQVSYDRYGWPTSISRGGMAGTRVISKLHKDAIPRGHYTVLYDGQGKLEYGLDAKVVQQQPGRDIIYIDPGDDDEYNVKLTITSTQPGNHLRNIRILPEGGICGSNPFQRVSNATQCRRNDYLDFARNYEKIIFNPDYLKFMRDYKVIRFMNMSGITRNPIQSWADRPHVNNATWGGAEGVRGAPIEIMVELANRLHADAWFNIPHAANDDFVRRFAQYVKQNLNPDLKVYLEYSNETWNGIFSQHAYMKQGGQRLGLKDEASIAGAKFYSKRSVEIFRMWEQAFGGNQRLVRVLAGLTGNTKLTETMLTYENAYKHTDAFAIAPYVFGDTDALRRARSVQQVFQIMRDKRYGHSLPRVLESIRKQAAISNKYGVDLIAYEGGQHLIDMNTKKEMQHPNPLFYKANRHPMMGQIYKDLLTGWKQAGGKMFVHFSSPRTYNRFGSKGIKEYITQPDSQAPKQLAVQSFIKSNPCWWAGCRDASVYRAQKPQAHTTRDLATRSGDQPPPQPNTREEIIARNNPVIPPARPATAPQVQPEIPQLSSMYIPQIDTIPAPRNQPYNPPRQIYQDIPQLEPVMEQPRQEYRPILIALRQPPQENYMFGNRAVSDRAHNPNDPLNHASTYQLRRVISGQIAGANDLAAIWQSSWDQTNLYLRIAVKDDILKRDSVYNWEDDSIEIFLDADASKYGQYDRRNDFHMLYRWRDKRLQLGKNSAPISVAHTTQHLDGRYVLDLSIPWAAMNVRPRPGHRIGLDVHVNDDDNGGGREGKLAWYGTDEAYRNPSVLGEVVLR
ncbi:MAG: sugar-binding protein [Thiolinea sp.]